MKVRCHVVPEFYQNYFVVSEDGCFWVYDKEFLNYSNKECCKPLKPTNALVMKNYYLSDKNAQGKRTKEVEIMLSKIEDSAKRIFDKWIGNPNLWQEEDIPTIGAFLAFMYCRVPRAVQAMNEMNLAGFDVLLNKIAKANNTLEKRQKEYNGFIASTERGGAPTFEQYSETIEALKSGPSIKVNEKYNLGRSLLMADVIFPHLMQMQWALYVAPKSRCFITSDAPLNVFVPFPNNQAIFGMGFALPAVDITFPITPKICLRLGYRRRARIQKASAGFVREVNRRMVYDSERFVISSYRSGAVFKILNEFSSHYKEPKINKEMFKDMLIQREALRRSRD